jgi:single-strand DNA-binding protein
MAFNRNKVEIAGNLTRDPETRTVGQKGTLVADITVAVNRYIPGENGAEGREEVDYIDVTIWGKQAKTAQEYLTKGRGVFIDGRLRLETWEDRETGQKRSKLKVVCEHMQLLGGGRGAENGGGEPSSGKPQQRRPAPAPRPQPQRDPDLDDEPSDIPFRTRIYRDVRRSKLNRRVF